MRRTLSVLPLSALYAVLTGWEGVGGAGAVGQRLCRGASARGTGDGLGRVVLEQGLQEHAHRAEHAHKHKDPQEESVNHHSNVLPVLAHLWKWGGETRGEVLREEQIKSNQHLHSSPPYLPPP